MVGGPDLFQVSHILTILAAHQLKIAELEGCFWVWGEAGRWKMKGLTLLGMGMLPLVGNSSAAR